MRHPLYTENPTDYDANYFQSVFHMAPIPILRTIGK